MNARWEEQKERIRNLTLSLRRRYYHEHKGESCYFSTPHGIAGNVSESIGPWPEFIFRGTFCKRTFEGCCSPCFYSQFSIDKRQKGIEYEEMIRQQYNSVIENFDEWVVKRQYGDNDYEGENLGEIAFVLTPTGSYFDEVEFPQKLRIEMLKRLEKLSHRYKIPFRLHIEAHCKDWNVMNRESKNSKEELDLLRKLNTKILFGFESADEYVRNVLYNKNIDMLEFKRAYNTVRDEKLEVGIFIFAGLFSMNNILTIEDVSRSLKFAFKERITPVLMFQNVQQYTITDILFRMGKISLIEPFTVMEIVLKLVEELEIQDENIEWLIADPKGGPPIPEFNIFDCAKVTSRECADEIYQMIHELRLSKDLEKFKKKAEKLKHTNNYKEYYAYLKEEKNINLEKHTEDLIRVAEDIVD